MARTTRSLMVVLLASAAILPLPLEAACDNCGRVVDVKTVKKQGEGTGLGAVAGGVVGGVIGHQIGSGRGNDIATVAGAAGGAYAGHQIEKNQRSTTVYHVVVDMEGGKDRTFVFNNPPSYKVGDAVKVVDGKLRRR